MFTVKVPRVMLESRKEKDDFPNVSPPIGMVWSPIGMVWSKHKSTCVLFLRESGIFCVPGFYNIHVYIFVCKSKYIVVRAFVQHVNVNFRNFQILIFWNTPFNGCRQFLLEYYELQRVIPLCVEVLNKSKWFSIGFCFWIHSVHICVLNQIVI